MPVDRPEIMESQFLEGGANGNETLAGNTPEQRKRRAEQVRQNFSARYRGVAERYRERLGFWYSKNLGDETKFAEAFEICEYGRKPTNEELAKVFPFFPQPPAAKQN